MCEKNPCIFSRAGVVGGIEMTGLNARLTVITRVSFIVSALQILCNLSQ